jgi:hypothetical protein
MDYYSDEEEAKYREYEEREKRLDEMEERAERERMIVPHSLKTKKEKMKYYEWVEDYERNPGFAPSYYEFMEKIERSRKRREQKKLRNSANPPK